MKKLIAILAVLMITAMAAYADGFNPTVTSHADFTCTVISPLTWAQMSPVTLPICIKGQDRPISQDVTFTLNGEGTHAVEVTTSENLSSGTGTAAVTLTGAWTSSLGTYAAPKFDGALVAGAATVNFHASNIHAGVDATGTATFTISVSAIYTDL